MAFADEELPLLSDDDTPPVESRGFAPEQMVRCDVCLRANPPTRSECLYCAARLPVTETSQELRQPALRRLEKWERGFNCILLRQPSAPSLSEEELDEAARLLRLESATLKRIAENTEPLPLARTATLDDATLIKDRLAAVRGFEVLIVDDEALALESRPPLRLRALEFTENAVVAYPTGGGREQKVSWTQVSLLVTGRLFVRRIEVAERRPLSGAEPEIVDAREFGADEALLDIYVAPDQERWDNWRITSNNFDFSCLGEEKNLLAMHNFRTLIAVLQKKATSVELSESYYRVRPLLIEVWPLEQQTEARGWHRERPGKYSTEAAVTSDNEKQFTLYSRLQHHLLMFNRGLT
ncbi:MAG: hypothetical protein ABR577_15290 [Pyrinomonadaceae bacterium]